MLGDHALGLGGGGVAGIAWITGGPTGTAGAGRAPDRAGLPDVAA